MARGALPPVRKSLGQHFLSDKRILTRIVDALDPRPDETVIEIGPGRGALTDILKERAGRVVAVEYDRALAELLRQRYAGSNVEVVQADVLASDFAQLAGPTFAVVGNVPYYITTPILFHALQRPRAERAVFLVQREVAERMAAPAGSDAYGALSVNLQALAHAEMVFGVPRGAFHPPPKVDSAVVRVIPLQEPMVRPDEEQGFREFVQSAFGMRRKQLRRVLRGMRPLDAAGADALLSSVGIDPTARPETLDPERFAALYRRFRA
ncbi:MAG TPA: 16S rRNA (adenine(1518)-N(6)/adenine(1519)-N(6))-dimethyltransferase RsmA [Gemmatimonadaceae bacterium]|nr:16S rRNA (adenine(1518)-N(6)/adenine(1519)-N(6))-dimethyltransferase RsmA [Gemmatimonadaceae bacterium]